MTLEAISGLACLFLAGLGPILAHAGLRWAAVISLTLAAVAWVVMFAAGESR